VVLISRTLTGAVTRLILIYGRGRKAPSHGPGTPWGDFSLAVGGLWAVPVRSPPGRWASFPPTRDTRFRSTNPPIFDFSPTVGLISSLNGGLSARTLQFRGSRSFA